jgi:hypothetical protein
MADGESVSVEVAPSCASSCAFLSAEFGWSVFKKESYSLRINRAVSNVCEALLDHAHHSTEALCTQLKDFARLLNLVPGKHGFLLPSHVENLLDCILPLLENETTCDCLLEQLCRLLLCKSVVVKTAKRVFNWRAIAQRWSQMYAEGNKVVPPISFHPRSCVLFEPFCFRSAASSPCRPTISREIRSDS